MPGRRGGGGGGNMGIIGNAMKYGTAAFAAQQAGKAFKDYNTGKQQQQQQQYQQGPPPQQGGYYGGGPQQQQYQQGGPPPQQHHNRDAPAAGGPPGQFYDQAGYLHQSWCNGECQRQCNAAGNAAGQGSRNMIQGGETEMYYDGGAAGGKANFQQHQQPAGIPHQSGAQPPAYEYDRKN